MNLLRRNYLRRTGLAGNGTGMASCGLGSVLPTQRQASTVAAEERSKVRRGLALRRAIWTDSS